MRQSPLPIPGYVAVIILIVATAALNVAGLKWGLPNHSSWNSDSIAGLKTANMIPRLYKSWKMGDRNGKPVIERYPRAQFLITGTIYKSFINQWKKDTAGIIKHPDTGLPVRDPRTGRPVSAWDYPYQFRHLIPIEQISTLILVSRIVTVVMAIGAVLGVFATTRLLTRSSLAGFLAAMVLMFSAEFTYFSHLGNLDTPVTFWFVWTGYLAVRALQTGRFKYFGLLGLFAAMVVCTKDPSVGHLAGLVAFTVAAAGYHYYRRRAKLADVCKVAIEPRLWLALGCFAVVFIVMNNVITDWAAFSARIQHWAGVKKSYVGSAGQQWQLIRRAVNCIRFDSGLWMFIALICSLVYCLIRYPAKALWAIAPFVMFHLTVTTHALQVQPRYHLPSLAYLAVMFGIAAGDLLRAKRIPLPLRAGPIFVVLVLAAMYAVSIDAEMINESRYRAEQWVRQNLDKYHDTITFISPSTYMPRSEYAGYRVNYSFSDMTTQDDLAGRPKLIGLSDMWYADPLHFDQTFRKKLLKEELGYRKLAEFGARFTVPGKGPFAAATIKTRRYRVLSPRIVFMERVD